MPPSLPKLYVSVDGADGVGKTRIIAHLKKILPQLVQKFGYSGVHFTKQPGGPESAVTTVLREMCLDPSLKMAQITNELLLLADFSENLEAVRKALDEGQVVVTDRGILTHYIYACAKGIVEDWHPKALLAISQDTIPTMTFVITCPLEMATARRSKRVHEFKQPDRMEAAGQQFQCVVNTGFSDYLCKIGMWHYFQLEGVIEVPNKFEPEYVAREIFIRVAKWLKQIPLRAGQRGGRG